MQKNLGKTVVEHLQNHKSIRSYADKPIDDDLLNSILLSGQRASSAGNLQSWSVIVSKDAKKKQQLYEAHYQQSMVLQAPVVLTFCADFYRTISWLKAHQAKLSFDDFAGFLTGAVDAVIAAQNIAVAAEAHGLGICYMGTTLWSSDTICKILKTPDYVIPVTSLVMGYPNEDIKEVRYRLPLQAVVHQEEYVKRSDKETLDLYAEFEERSWKRYGEFPGMLEKLEKAGIKKVADFYTSDLKYSKALHVKASKMLMALLKDKKFW
ncbi:MAG TPA: nitroreductase family protein [Oligoflexia bacterium]|nr:nitroreductase family protein [Oligoflexia bacterium]HMR25652.1 nitroreductase family protein [Oligoflexia bacterium]